MPYEVKQITMVTTSSSHRLLISIVSVNFPSILAEATASGSHQTTKCLQLIYTRQSSLASHQEIREWFLCRWRRLLACVSIIFINVTSCCCSCANFVIIIQMTKSKTNLSCQGRVGFRIPWHVESSIHQGQLSAPWRHMGMGRCRRYERQRFAIVLSIHWLLLTCFTVSILYFCRSSCHDGEYNISLWT